MYIECHIQMLNAKKGWVLRTGESDNIRDLQGAGINVTKQYLIFSVFVGGGWGIIQWFSSGSMWIWALI